MALQVTKEFPQGFTAPNAYLKITTFRGDNTMVHFDCGIFYDEAARNSNKQALDYYNFDIPYQDGMSISSLYTYLKTLPEFANAIDV